MTEFAKPSRPWKITDTMPLLEEMLDEADETDDGGESESTEPNKGIPSNLFRFLSFPCASFCGTWVGLRLSIE